jgi:uncharacterized repeat protein (TIGR01451 family)
MTSIFKRLKAATGLAALLSLLAGVQVAHATGTTAGTTVSNTATVNYNVGGVAQAPITSAPTQFVVDNRIDLTVTEVSGDATNVVPGQTNAVLTYLVSNTGNSPQGYELTATNEVGTTLFTRTDNADFATLNVFVDVNGNGNYDPGTDNLTNVNTLANDTSVRVFVVANVPAGAVNAQVVNVRLQARAALPGTSGGTLATETTGADTAGVDVVFGDAGRDGLQTAVDQYFVQSAALNISKTSTVLSDPFNLAVNPKAIPGATVEYVVTIANTGAAAAGGISVSDTLNANLAFVQGAYTGATDVQIQVGASPATFCVAEQGADSNSDGCSRAGQTLTVNPTSAISVPAGQSATVRFRATIN